MRIREPTSILIIKSTSSKHAAVYFTRLGTNPGREAGALTECREHFLKILNTGPSLLNLTG